MAIELLQYDAQSAHTEKKELSITNVSNWYWRLYCPWEWNWYGFKKKIQPKAQNKYFYSPTEPELPSGIIIGAVEAFAGALLMIIPSGISQGIGLLLITDGGRRVFDQLEIIGDKNAQEQSQYSFP